LLILALGAFMRLGDLHLRPLHGDESLNTFKFAQLLRGDGYQYDPAEYHGPTLPYTTLLAAKISGAETYTQTTESMYRAVTVGFGLLLVLVTAFGVTGSGRKDGEKGIGWGAGWIAALLCALSTPLVFYSRYYISSRGSPWAAG
jgi:predicted membrane-bound mannosyltransferase